ncbi:hypothetical protein O0I10_003290 [Lichtheimia ornata]|uniref:SigF-like NTF2-like domain-containing protein n=1 Tax=Lichtheimia ornata TaxID=688661 RepID=A0AAD7VAT9_9FUNG|nr:uncharacterized protein O0I10_003290 [Lichtheimia ornata]KAJ8661067.1 hypothetical protein O0I10_003290 [Lichtheimia ornata]
MGFSLAPLAHLFKMSDSDSDTASQHDSHASPAVLIKNIVKDLFSYDTVRRRRILEFYFVKDAILTTPLIAAHGVDAISNIGSIWQNINRSEPTITNIVFDGRTAVVHYIQNISPAVLPSRYTLRVPAITTLHFKEQDGLIKIYRQDDSWTMEGLMQSIPGANFWYNRILRVAMGKMASMIGDTFQDTASWQQHMYSTAWEEQEEIVVDDSKHAYWQKFEEAEEKKRSTTNELVEGMIVLEDA